MTFALGYFCKIDRKYQEMPCVHKDCLSDPSVRADDDTLIAFATTCSSARIRLSAEVALRKRYPSQAVK
jgi:hypothetical protein